MSQMQQSSVPSSSGPFQCIEAGQNLSKWTAFGSIFSKKSVFKRKRFESHHSWKIVCKNPYDAERVFNVLKFMCIGECPTGAEIIGDCCFDEQIQQVQGWLFKTEG